MAQGTRAAWSSSQQRVDTTPVVVTAVEVLTLTLSVVGVRLRVVEEEHGSRPRCPSFQHRVETSSELVLLLVTVLLGLLPPAAAGNSDDPEDFAAVDVIAVVVVVVVCGGLRRTGETFSTGLELLLIPALAEEIDGA